MSGMDGFVLLASSFIVSFICVAIYTLIFE